MTGAGLAAASLSLADAIGWAAPRLGFGLERVSVTGHRMTNDRDIFGALDLQSARSLAFFDIGAARARVERLPWIASAEIRPVFPNALDIRVVERRPAAVWRLDGEERLIDRDGRTLGEAAPEEVRGLPRIAGDGAASEAAAALAALAAYPRVARHIAMLERVAGRRWTLRTASGAEVLLPAEREMAALARLSRLSSLDDLLSGAGRVIDLRAGGRAVLRERPDDPAGKASS